MEKEVDSWAKKGKMDKWMHGWMAPQIDGLVNKESNVKVFSVHRVLKNQSSSFVR